MKCIFDAGLLFFHLGFGCSADLNDCNAAGELGEPFLEFLLVIIGGGLFDLGLDLVYPVLYIILLPAPSTIVVLSLSMLTFLACPRSGELHVLKLHAEVFGDDLSACEHGDIFEHRLAPVAESGSLYGAT